MDVLLSGRILYFVWVLLNTFNLLTCIHPQGAGDVWFSFNGTVYKNNSCVALEDIGEGNDALLCVTNLTDCCRRSDTGTGSALGIWFFPNESNVPNEGKKWDFYKDRGQMKVDLNRRRGGVEGIYRCEIPDSMNVKQTIYIGVYTTNTVSANITLPSNVGTTAITGTVQVSSSIQPTKTDGATRCAPVSSIQPTKTDGATRRAPVSSSIQPTMTDGATKIASVSSSINNAQCDEAFTTTVPASQSTKHPPSDGATLVIIVVAVVIILFVIVVGVVILVVLFRTKKRNQQLEVNKLQNVMMEYEDIEMKLKQEGFTEKEDSSSANQPPYTEVQTEAPPSKLEELKEHLNQNSTLTGEYSEIELEPNDSKHALPAKPPRHVKLSEEMESSTVCQDVDQYSDPISTTNVLQGSVDSPSDSEHMQLYGPIYTLPINLPKSEKVPLKVFCSNIQEVRELGMGQFGKVVLAETVGLSSKDLKLSESDDDKSKSTLVAVKKLKWDAPNTTKEAFEKEIKFMSRLTDKNVIRILGVCYEDTPFIMMEYMEKGDLNQYLQKFKKPSTTDSEPQGQITTSTLVHMTTQIASAMKYLASHNFVHRDLATRNCLVGPNYLVKISDFGMSKSLYDSHYYRIHGRFSLPVRWMAFECFYGKFSQKSDVWAFGVTMWEIFTLAKEQPYNYLSDEQVVEDALKGKNRKTLSRPDMCPLKVYKIMLECWEHNSNQRATFEELFQLLTSVHQDV